MGADPGEQASLGAVLEEIGEEIAGLEEAVDADGLPDPDDYDYDVLGPDQRADVLVTRLKLLKQYLEDDERNEQPPPPWYQ